MRDRAALLSRAMLVLGGILLLAGLSWGLRSWLRAPPQPVLSDAGAIVLAVTAPSDAVTATGQATPAGTVQQPSPSATPGPILGAPTPDLLPDWTAGPDSAAEISPPETLPPLPATPVPTATATPRVPGPPTRIVAPAIGLDAQVVPMTWQLVDRKGKVISEWVVPKNAAGWHANSALPGQGENIVISGHHNIEGKVFRYVVDLNPGDEITLYVGDVPYVYTVTEKYILREAGMPLQVRRQNAQWIMPTGDERLTLVTCWPYEWPGNSHRVIVVARPPDYFLKEPDSPPDP